MFNYDDLAYKLDKLYIEGKLTELERDELLTLAAEKASDAEQVDVYAKLVDLEHRIVALETADIPIWTAGYTTKKGEVVKFDYDKDGEYDLLRYDGGRASTALSPGKIDGWHVVDFAGNILGTYYNGEFTPVNDEEVGE
jgi:hypothetical protein